MFNLFSIIAKNFKVLSRSKLSAAAIILTPLLIVLLAGVAFNSSSLQGIEIGVYKEGTNNMTESILSDFKEQDFQISEVNSKVKCKEVVKEGESQICLIFPTNFSSNKLEVHADKSRMDIAYYLINEINSKVSAKSSNVGSVRASRLLNTSQEARQVLVEQKERISQVRDNLDSIISKGEDLSSSLSKIPSITQDLEDVKTALDNLDTNDSVSGIKDDIDSAISSLPSSNQKAVDIVEDSEQAKEKLREAESELENIISDLQEYEDMEPREISSPIRTEVNSLTEASNWKLLFSTFISLVVLFGSLILGSAIVMREKKSRAYFRNFITSTSDLTFFMGLYLTCLTLLFLQIGIVLASLHFIINMSLLTIIWKLLLIVFLSGTIFIFLGMFIGYLFNSEETIVLTSISMAALLIFFSNIILPAEAISGAFKKIATYNPLVITNSILRRVVLFNTSLHSMIYDLSVLGGILIGLFILAFGLKVLTKRSASM